jgi:hypothetical protein
MNTLWSIATFCVLAGITIGGITIGLVARGITIG